VAVFLASCAAPEIGEAVKPCLDEGGPAAPVLGVLLAAGVVLFAIVLWVAVMRPPRRHD